MSEDTPSPSVKRPRACGVVVGDDGSDGALTALRFAAEEARRRGTGVRAVRAWTLVNAAKPEGVPFGYVPSEAELAEATRAETERRLRRAVAEVGDAHDVETDVEVVHGLPARSLLHASRDAEALVVGSRGLGGFASLLLGSVADQVVRHSQVPVIVVR